MSNISNKIIPHKIIPKLKRKNKLLYNNQRKIFKNINTINYIINNNISSLNQNNDIDINNKYKEYLLNKLKILIIRKLIKYKSIKRIKPRYIYKPGKRKRTYAANRARIKLNSYRFSHIKKKDLLKIPYVII